jgi:hypothetical protein
MKNKTCMYCKKEFTDSDFPHSFDRMITCGNIECTGKRRKELWKKRHNKA